MAWNGSGTFSRLYNWVADRDADVKIQALKMDDEMDGFTTGIHSCLTKNGENAAEADLPMATYKHTNVGDADARNQYPAVNQVQDGDFNYAAASGTDTIAANYIPAITAYATGVPYWLKIANTNTGAVTANFNAIGAKSVVKGVSTALVAGDLPAGALVALLYNNDNDNFQVLHYSTNTESGSFTGTLTGFTSNPSGTIKWERTGNKVTLISTGDITGTSNSSAMNMTGLDAAIYPTTNQTVLAGEFVNGSVSKLMGFVSINSSGTINLEKLGVASSQVLASGWQTSLTKGISAGWSVTYELS